MKKLLILAAALCFTQAPLCAETDDAPAEKTELTHAEKKLQQKIKKAKKRLAALKKHRAKMKFKWCSSLKVALDTAKKANTTCLVVWSNPSNCPYCVKLEAEVFNNKKFKKAKGIGVGYISTQALPNYQVTSLPGASIVGPDGKVIQAGLGYTSSGGTLERFLEAMTAAQPTWDAMEAEIAAMEEGGAEEEESTTEEE